MKNKKILFIASFIILVSLFFITTKLYKNNEAKKLSFLNQENAEIFVRNYSPQLGNPDAKVFITEFLDPECESCRKFYPIVKDILKEFDGKVKLVVRYVPFHRNSKMAIAAVEASRIQGKYWEALELLFEYQPKWGNHHNPQPNLIFEYLPTIGINLIKLKSDMKNDKIKNIIEQDLADARKLNIRGTPTFFVNGKPLESFGIEFLKKAIKTEVDKLY